jgi:hypothetical protein
VTDPCNLHIGGGAQVDLNAPPGIPGIPQSYIQSHNLDEVQALCSHGLSPSLAVGIILQVLKHHFSSPALILEPALSRYVYDADPSKSKIRIVTNTHFDPRSSGQLPAIVVKRAALESKRQILNDSMGYADQRAKDVGENTYVRFLHGGVRVFALAETDGQAEDLSLEIFDTLTYLGPAMVERLPFFDVQVMNLGELGVLDGLGNVIGVPIDISYIFEYAWAIQPLAPRLKTLNLATE